MDTVEKIGSGHNTDHLAEAIKELSRQVEDLAGRIAESLQQISPEESEALRRYKNEGTLLEFTLVTGGLIKGKILWEGNQSLGIRTDSDQNVILYKHAIAFIQ